MFCYFGFVQRDTSIWYHMTCKVVALVDCWGTLLRPTAGAVVLIRKCVILQSVPCLCSCIQEESCAISWWSSTATSAVESYRQCSFGLGHGRTHMSSDLRAVAPRCLSRENAGRTTTILHQALCSDDLDPTLISKIFLGTCSKFFFSFVGDATQV